MSVRFKHCCFCEGKCNNKMSSQRRVSEMQKKASVNAGSPKMLIGERDQASESIGRLVGGQGCARQRGGDQGGGC